MKKSRNYHAINAHMRNSAGPMKNKGTEKIETLEDSIPQGIYCYDENGTCPYWKLVDGKPQYENGYCSYLKEGDWESDGIGLLWDQVKECGIKDEEPEFDQ